MSKPTDPTLIEGLPESFLAHPARLRPEPSNSGTWKRWVEQWKASAPAAQPAEDDLQLLGRLGDPRLIVVDLPLGQAEEDREVRGDGFPAGFDQLRGEAGARGRVTAVRVGAPVGAGPEELVDEVAVAAVDLDAVEAEGLRLGGRRGEGSDHLVDVRLGHGHAMFGAVQGDARGADPGSAGDRRGADGAVHARVPQLRYDPAAGPVDLVRHRGPARQGLGAVEAGDAGAAARRLVADVRALGDDQADAARRAASVVPGHVGAGDAVGGVLTGHRCHDDAVGQREAAE